MGKLVVLKLDGDLNSGFQVTMEIGEEGSHHDIAVCGYLPPLPDLKKSLDEWQQNFRRIEAHYRVTLQRVTENGSIEQHINECQDVADKLQDSLEIWLRSEQFRPIDSRLREELNPEDSFRMLIRTDSEQLQKLPWHLWDFVKRYSFGEVALSPTQYERQQKSPTVFLKNQVRILAILGHNEGINIEADKRFLENLPNAETVFILQKTHQEINNKLWEQPWDIIFFAGHSETEGETGRIYINQTDSLTIDKLLYGLRKAVDRGLKLAIFNSCDGLGLARRLDDLHIPQMIVMRDLVPDKVAQDFLRNFLKAFAGGTSLYLAVREAREQLQGLESKYPCATWLPVIFQNPAEDPPTWEELLNGKKPVPPPHRPPKLKLTTALVASVIVTSLMMGMRWLGILQSSELQAFDHFMQLRPSESADSRILLVEVNEEDIQKYNFPLPDVILGQLLDKLQQNNPIVIGLDIYRDQPVPPKHEAIVPHLNNPRLITVCKFNLDKKEEGLAVAPPRESPTKQVGFVNLQKDQYRTVHRYLLSRTQNLTSPFDTCNSGLSFSFQLAFQYLKAQNIPVTITPTKDWQFGKILFKRLELSSGGYQNLDARGNQVLINYRKSPQIGKQVRITDILTDRFDPKWIKDKIVLIGVTAESQPDPYNTPYGEMRGLFVHAQMISQILSSAIDGKYLPFWWLPQWGDTIWVWFWSLTGGLLVCRFHSSRLSLWLAVSISIAVLYVLCLGFFIQGGWLPLIPSTLALVATGVAVVFYSELPTRKLK